MKYEEAYKILTHEDEYGLIKSSEAICKATEAVAKQIPKKSKSKYYPQSTIRKCEICPICGARVINDF
jgi:hypothetical protein